MSKFLRFFFALPVAGPIRRAVVLVYGWFRFALNPLVRWLKKSEWELGLIDAVRGWKDESEWRALTASLEDHAPDMTAPAGISVDRTKAGDTAAVREPKYSPDRKILSLIYENLGDGFLHKGDHILAEKMFVQSDVCDPDSDTVLGKINFIRHERDGATAGNHPETRAGKKFDFLCVPMYRCASSHYSAMLPLHPEIHVVQKAELDTVVETESEDKLLNEYWRRTMSRRPDVRVGLVQHSYIAGMTGPPEIAGRLSEIVAKDGYIQGVRDPFELLRSIYNHRLISEFGGSYKFNSVNPDTPFSGDILGIENLAARHADPDSYTNRSFSIEPPARQQILDEAISRIRFHAVGKIYADCFDGWRAIDLPRASRDVNGGRMAEFFEAIGVNADYKNPLYATPHANQIHRLFAQNFVNMRIFDGSNVTFFLGISGQTIFSNVFDFVELCWMAPDDQCRELGIDQPICLCIPTTYWSEERRGNIRRMIEEGFAERLMRKLVPIWIANAKAWRKTIDPFLTHEFDQAKRVQLFGEFRDDLSKFLTVHGRFAALWPSVSELLKP